MESAGPDVDSEFIERTYVGFMAKNSSMIPSRIAKLLCQKLLTGSNFHKTGPQATFTVFIVTVTDELGLRMVNLGPRTIKLKEFRAANKFRRMNESLYWNSFVRNHRLVKSITTINTFKRECKNFIHRRDNVSGRGMLNTNHENTDATNA